MHQNISGLHILAKNQIPELILHADVFSNILHGVSQHLLKDQVYTLLYGISVNQYYSMNIVKSFILNNVLYMTISLPLKPHGAYILFLYGLYPYYLPTNMSVQKSISSAYTKLEISHPYLLLSDDQFALYWMTPSIDMSFNMITCLYKLKLLCCSDVTTETVTPSELNMLLPKP